MAQILDVRGSGGELVVLGDIFTLPSSNAVANPMQGSLRFNPTTQLIELYDPILTQWEAIATQNYINSLIKAQTANVATLMTNLSNTVIGQYGYATDGRKPTEYAYGFSGRSPLANTVGSGVPVVVGYLNDANQTSNTTTWFSLLDGNIVSN